MHLNTIFFIGPQGSGKGTQAKILAQKLNFLHWEMGGILRAVAKEENELGKTVKNIINGGTLLSDEWILKIAQNKLDSLDPNQGIIFDGIPRRLGQAEFLISALKKQGRKDFVTVFIDLPKTETLKRLTLRAVKEGRADDTPEVIEKRLMEYEKDTTPVLDYLKGQTQFFEIDGTPDIDTVSQRINRVLEINE